ncbi:TPA: hypothetical protein ACHVCJ_000806 [Streptococcus suis]|uniref:hypothetical protein n=1 Tax=Streptococcus suis TaxID=1307 RepID=UPI0003FA542B|nr:hypothetical protein [Streptococcus suis 10581]HEM4128375.1 hypothetical protein [Streptococcus suis]HEM6393205.1 hypothetical protein [Streptococcus suis]HEM6437064.1 hypothetical protein [Streptococcus suis]
MSVFTEVKIRKLLKELSIADGGVFQLGEHEKLTPSARSYLNDHHIRVVQTRSNNQQLTTSPQAIHQKVTTLEDSAIYPILFRLTTLYPHFLKSKRELYLSFEQSKFEKVSKVLTMIEGIVSGQILDELHDYDELLPSVTELDEYSQQRELDFTKLSLTCAVTNWKLALYETYIALATLEQELSLIGSRENDVYLAKLTHLLHSTQIFLWMTMDE